MSAAQVKSAVVEADEWRTAQSQQGGRRSGSARLAQLGGVPPVFKRKLR
jgi:hypothetical protein